MDQTPAHATARFSAIPSAGRMLTMRFAVRPVSARKQFDQIIDVE
jgi:hypothetical protein